MNGTTGGPSGALASLARTCYRRRRWVLLIWIVGTVAVLYLGFGYGAAADNDFSAGNSQSGQAQSFIKKHFPQQNGDLLTLAVHADQGLADPSVKAKAKDVLARLGSAAHVVSVSSPYDVRQQVSPDGRTGFASIQTDVTAAKFPQDEIKKLIPQVRDASGGGVTFALGGGAVTTAETPYGGATEGIGIGAAMIVLLIAFGSLLAMGLPILTAVFGIGAGLALIQLLGYLFPAPSFSPVVASLLGLGVGIDYALFIVTRYREGLATGLDPEEATVTALATAGRAVLFAGSTVVIAMLGLLVMQQRLLNATAIAASTTVLLTMITAVTLLPAMLGFTGRNIDRMRLPLLGRTRVNSPLAERWARVIQRRPVTAAVLAVGTLLVLAVPALSMRLSFEDATTLPHSTSSYISHQILADGFGAGYDAPLVVVAELPPGGGSLQPVADATRATPGIALVTPVRVSPDGKAALFLAYPKTGQLDAATPRAVHTLRDTVVPRNAAPGMVVHVGGPNAGTIDFSPPGCRG
jgi:RND superfamily putative drug exporter